MKRIVFSEYSIDELSDQVKVWGFLYAAINNQDWKPKDKSQWKVALGLVNALDAITIKKPAEQPGQPEGLLLRGGSSLLLEDAEYELLKAAVDLLLQKLPLGAAKDVALIESYIEGAQTVSKAELTKEG